RRPSRGHQGAPATGLQRASASGHQREALQGGLQRAQASGHRREAPTNLFLFVEIQRRGIHAISHATWLRAVLVQMAQVTAVFGAMVIRATYGMAVVFLGLDRAL